jgi:CheY-like chemotaxis protein
MSVKRVLIAHRLAEVRDRFAVALADARHEFVTADTDVAACARAADAVLPIDLALIDAGLAEHSSTFVRALRQGARTSVPVVVFSGTVRSSAEVLSLSSVEVGYINEHATTAQIVPALVPLLFPDNFNRRGNPRVVIGLPVTYRVAQTITGAVTRDISKSGVSIRTLTPLPNATALSLKFRLPGSPVDVEAMCRVAWQDRKVGMGVMFEQVSANDQHAIHAFIADQQG